LQPLHDLRVFLGFQRLVHQAAIDRGGIVLQLLHGLEPLCALRRKQIERGAGRLQLFTHIVVVDHALRVVAGGDGFAGGQVDPFIAFLHLHHVAIDLYVAIQQLVQKVGKLRIGLGHGLVQGGDAGVGVAAGNGQRFLRGQGMGWWRQAEQ
jgi:hypothetical protein